MQKIVFERRFETALRNGEIRHITLLQQKYKNIKANSNVMLYIEGLGKYAEATITKIAYTKYEVFNAATELPDYCFETDNNKYFANLGGYDNYEDFEQHLKINQSLDTWIIAFRTYYFRINKFI